MKISKEQIVGFIIITGFFILIGFTIKLPLFGFKTNKLPLFDSLSPIELFFTCLTITLMYFLLTHFISPKGMLEKLETYKEPLQKVQNEKFNYWLKSLVFNEEIEEQNHFYNVEFVKGNIEIGKYNVLREAASLHEMEVSTFIKKLLAEAEANLNNAKTELEKTKAEALKLAIKGIEKFPAIWQAYIISCVVGSTREFQNDLEIQQEISKHIKDLKEQEVKKAKAETEAFELKMKHEQKKYSTNDKV